MVQHMTDSIRHLFNDELLLVWWLPMVQAHCWQSGRVPVIAMFLVSVDQTDLQAVCPGRRRSCALVNSPSPCVNKAIYHIQELKRKVEIWCQQVNC